MHETEAAAGQVAETLVVAGGRQGAAEAARMSEFATTGWGVLGAVARRFRLRVVAVDSDRLALADGDCAVLFTADRSDVDVAYVETAGRGGLRTTGMTSYFVRERLTPEDRALFGTPAGLLGYALASLRVYASGMENRCSDILTGDREWIRRLRARDPARWAGVPTDPQVAHALEIGRGPGTNPQPAASRV